MTRARNDDPAGSAKLWGGRFAGRLDPFFEEFNRSLAVDARLLDAELEASAAWAAALRDAGVLGRGEVVKLQRALRAIGAAVTAEPALLADSRAEDVHSFVEAELTARVGDLGRKLHTGRSRNDQVATDLKLHLRTVTRDLDAALTDCMRALAALGERDAALPLPGYTHLQRAQPITAGHHALAYVEMLARDRQRLRDATARMDTCPLGCAALAGTAFSIDRRALAKQLGFRAPAANSLDAVSDRDHCCELAFVASMVMLHLSRLAEDWIFFCSQEAGYLELSDAVATGSSLMPQKKNPDALELVRGKAGRVVAALHTLQLLLKGLPLAYNKDLQEDKEALFDALDTTIACLAVTTTVVRGARFAPQRCRAAAAASYQNATDVADLLVHRGVAFRDAHEQAGHAVRRALELGVEIEELPAEDRARLLPQLDADLARELDLDRVLSRRRCLGGTAPSRVRAAARRWKNKLQAAAEAQR